jgi:hypothetical protein
LCPLNSAASFRLQPDRARSRHVLAYARLDDAEMLRPSAVRSPIHAGGSMTLVDGTEHGITWLKARHTPTPEPIAGGRHVGARDDDSA